MKRLRIIAAAVASVMGLAGGVNAQTAVAEATDSIVTNVTLDKSAAVADSTVSDTAVIVAETPKPWALNYEAELLMAGGSNKFAPYYIMSNRRGVITQAGDALLRLKAVHDVDYSQRFSYGYGAEIVTGRGSGVDYKAYNPETKDFYFHREHPAPIFIQQLYGELKYRKVFLMVGLKDFDSRIVSQELSSGDLTFSGNSRNVPQVRVGFVDFVDVPLTKGWLQIDGVIAYGKYADNGWLKHHFNYYENHINLGGLYTYKRCHFRIGEYQPLAFTIGMQTAGSFGGTTTSYKHGDPYRVTHNSASLKMFWKMFLPVRGEGSEYYAGSSLGSWDLKLRYRFKNGAEIRAYLEKLWEDGSGIGWLNGFDGLWGLEYKAAREGSIVDGAVVEYLDFTNQSGSIHWAICDNPGTTLTYKAEGGDQYYNNYSANAYAYFGMGMGTPFLPSPIYNVDGYPAYVHNRIRGFHIALKGQIAPQWRYKLMGSYRRGWGDSRLATATSPTATCLMAEATYSPAKISGLHVKTQLATDLGDLLGNRWGVAVAVSYKGKLF